MITLRKMFGRTGAVLLGLLAASPLVFAQSPQQAPAIESLRQSRIVQSVRNDKLSTLRCNIHLTARAENDRGALPLTQPVTRMHLLLQRSSAQETALQQLLADQQDPKYPRYHAWLTPQQFGEQYGPAESDIQAVKDWLSSQGFSNLKPNSGKTLIEFDGTAGQIRNAFHTDVHRLSVNGNDHFANMQEPQIPEALAPVVGGIKGLANFHPKPLLKRLGKFQRNANTGEVSPLFTFSDVNGTFFGVGPADFKKIYNVPSALDGTGVSIAIVAQSNINLQDAADFRSIFGLPAKAPTVILNGPDPGLVSGDEGESDLDVEWSSAVAPNATIVFVPTLITNTDGGGGVDESAEFIVDNNLAPILSDSYGACESGLGTAGNQFYQLLWQQAAAQGMTVVVSAGDNGSANCDDPNSVNSATHGIAVSGIASTPFDVAMGGTDFDQVNNTSAFWNSTNTGSTQVSAKGYIPEIVWNDSCAASATSSNLTVCANATTSSTTSPLDIVAGSGGPSSVYVKPAFQAGISGIPTDGKRDLPDVSLFSSDGQNKSFYIVCQSDADITGDTGCNLTTFSPNMPFHDFQAVGGTSAAAPTFAAIMALINQKTGQRQGNANIELYNLARAESFSSCNSSSFTNPSSAPPATCVFLDVTKGTNDVPCVGASTNCSKTNSGGNGVLVSGSAPAFAATAGYDLATGLGSVNVTNLTNAWTTASAGGTVPTVTLNPASVSGTAGSVSGSLSGTVTGSGGTPTGVVVIENSATGAPLTSAALSGGSYSVAAAFLPAGTYSAKAHYSGDSNFAPKDSAPIAVTLSKQASQVLVSFVNSAGTLVTAAQTVAYGSPYILRVDVENAGGTACQNASGVVTFVCPTGTVSLSDGGSSLKDFPNAQTGNASNVARLNDRGFIEDQPIQLNVGSHSITAAYSADASSSYNSNSSSNTLSVTITKATTTTTVSSNVTSVTSGGSVTLTATISSQSNSSQGPTGTVQFMNGSASIGVPATCTAAGATSSAGATCTAQLTTALSALPPGFFRPPPPRNTPFVIWTALAAALAFLSFLLAAKLAARRKQFAYAAAAFLLIATAALAGCSGSTSGGGGGGGGGGGSSRSITANYSGDSNYTSSTSSAISITVK